MDKKWVMHFDVFAFENTDRGLVMIEQKVIGEVIPLVDGLDPTDRGSVVDDQIIDIELQYRAWGYQSVYIIQTQTIVFEDYDELGYGD